MTVLLAFAEDYPWDVRIEKILSSLNQNDYGTALVCRNIHGRARAERIDGTDVFRVGPPRWHQSLRAACSVPAFFNPLWRDQLNAAIDRVRATLLIVRDVPLAPLAINVGRRNDIPVILDMAENHPAMWRNVAARDPLRVPSLVTKNPKVAEAMERYAIKNADAILVVVEEMRERLVALGAPRKRIAVVSNTPELGKSSAIEPAPLHGPHHQDHPWDISVVYVGHVSQTRGLQHVVRAVARLKCDHGLLVRFEIVGSGAYCRNLEQLARQLGVSDLIVFHGWISHDRMPAIVSSCDVGVIPHQRSEHIDTTVPNKLFDYMAAGKPVIVTDARPLSRIITEEECGLTFASGNHVALADAILAVREPGRRAAMGCRGRDAVRNKYNWDRDRGVLLETVQRVIAGT